MLAYMVVVNSRSYFTLSDRILVFGGRKTKICMGDDGILALRDRIDEGND